MATQSLNRTRTESSETLPCSPFPHRADCQSEVCYDHRRSKADTRKDGADENRLTGTTATTSTSATLTNNAEDDVGHARLLRASLHGERRASDPTVETVSEQAMMEFALHTVVRELN